MLSSRIVSALLASALMSSPAVAQDVPAPQELLERAEAIMPSGWALSDFKEVASKKSDDPIKPVYSVRFEVTATTTTPLYLVQGESIGPFSILVETLPAGSARTLYGTTALTYEAGAWAGAINIENPVTKLGTPLERYEDPTLILGTEEYATTVAELKEADLERLSTKHEQELVGLRMAHEREMAALRETHEKQKNDLVSGNREALARLRQEAATEIDDLKLEHHKRLAALQREHQQQVDKLSQQHAAALAENRRKSQEEIRALTARNAAELNRLRLEGERRIGAEKARIAGELKRIEAGYLTRKEELERIYADSQELLDLQEKLIEVRQSTLDNEAFLVQLTGQAAKYRREMTGNLMGTWSGTAICDDAFLPRFSFTAAFEEYLGGDLAGNITVTSESTSRFAQEVGQSRPATLSVLSELGETPTRIALAARSQAGRAADRLQMTLQVRNDGTLRGVSGDSGQCKITMNRG